MKKILLSGLTATLLVSGAFASDINNNSNIRLYGAGDKISDKSYNGAGMQFENDFSNIVIENGSDYTKSSAVLKYDITKDIYIKGGIGYLKREMSIEEVLKDVIQKTGGVAFGYGDTKKYNLELGYIINDLSGASNANGKSKTSYIEFVGLHEFGEFATFDLVGSYKNTNVFDKNYDDSLVELGYFPISDIRTFVQHNSVNHDSDDYAVKVGIQYTFGTKNWSPFLKATTNTNENVLVGVEYRENIINKSLKMRDVFENSVGTSDIVAQNIAPKVFASKTAKEVVTPSVTNSAPVWTASSYNTGLTITDANNAEQTIKDLTVVSSDNEGDAMSYSIVSISVPHIGDQTAWNNSVYLDNGVLKVHNLQTNDPALDGTISVVVKITATGGSNNTTVNFTYDNVQ